MKLSNTKNLQRYALVTAGFLLIVLVATLVTDHIQWGVFDFIFAGALLFGACMAYEHVAPKMPDRQHRIIVVAVLCAIVFIVWVAAATNFGM